MQKGGWVVKWESSFSAGSSEERRDERERYAE